MTRIGVIDYGMGNRRSVEKALELLSAPSPERREPSCRHFATCGGCVAQHMSELLYASWKRGIVVDRIPGNVQGDGGAAAREAVDQRRVGDSLVNGAGGARPGVDVEAGSRVAVATGRGFDREAAEAVEHLLLVHRS